MALICLQVLKDHGYDTWLFAFLYINNTQLLTPIENDRWMGALC